MGRVSLVFAAALLHGVAADSPMLRGAGADGQEVAFGPVDPTHQLHELDELDDDVVRRLWSGLSPSSSGSPSPSPSPELFPCINLVGYERRCPGIDWAMGGCAVLVTTDGGSCTAYCQEQGRHCLAASDNYQFCDENADAQGRPGTPKTSSYCNATFGDQICVCSEEYDCEADVDSWAISWSAGKAAWCCKHHHRGCIHADGEPFDCEAGFVNWKKGWSAAKAKYCCNHHQKGCTEE